MWFVFISFVTGPVTSSCEHINELTPSHNPLCSMRLLYNRPVTNISENVTGRFVKCEKNEQNSV
jgi:hypothetical protein